MKKRTKIILIITLVIIVIAAGSLLFSNAEKQSVNLITEKTGRATISNTVTATGRLEASVTVEVGTQVSGKIDKLYVDFNSQVTKGQLIAMIDTEALQSSLESSKATLNQAEAEYEYQKANYNRYEQLFNKELIALQDFDEVKYKFKAAEANLANARAAYSKNKTNLEYAYIYSPIDGIVLDKQIEEGETVAASFNTPTLFTIVNDLTQMEIEADIDEADIGQVILGQRVEFTVDAFPYKTFSGEITEIRLMPVETSNVITYTVIINAPNPEKILMPGMTANVTVYVTEKKDILVIPNRAFEFQPDPGLMQLFAEKHPEVEIRMPEIMPDVDSETIKTAWVFSSNTIYPVQLIVGETDEINYEVLGGIKENMEVIISMEGQVNPAQQSADESKTSPFMPTPPGGKKKN